MFGKKEVKLTEEQEFLTRMLCNITTQAEYIFERLDETLKSDAQKGAMRNAFMNVMATSLSTDDITIRVKEVG